jgi:hypothetical protein
MIGCLAIGGCSTTGSSTPNAAGNYWLVRVRDGYGNIYNYSAHDRPPQKTAQAVYLGPTKADADANAPSAAKRLGIAHLDPNSY